MKTIKTIILLGLMVVTMTGCAPHEKPDQRKETKDVSVPSTQEIIREYVLDYTDTELTAKFENEEFKINFPQTFIHITETTLMNEKAVEVFSDSTPPHENTYFGMAPHELGLLIAIYRSDNSIENFLGSNQRGVSEKVLLNSTPVIREEIQDKYNPEVKVISLVQQLSAHDFIHIEAEILQDENSALREEVFRKILKSLTVK